MRRHSDGVTFRTTDSKNIDGRIRKIINYNFLEYVTHWKQYVDNTIAVIKLTSTENVLPTLNNFQQNIKFTYELEQKRKIKLLDILLIRHPANYYIYI